MAKPVLTLNITGIEKSLNNLKNNYEKMYNMADNEMEATFEQMVTHSKQLFPSAPNTKDQAEYTRIRTSIRYEKKGPLHYELIAGYGKDPKNPAHALPAYIEFGTGPNFDKYPGKDKEWQDLAYSYYKSGKGWMNPSPYFYPVVKLSFFFLLKRLQDIFDKNERL